MPKDSLRPGLSHAETILVTDRLIVPFVEWTCARALADHLLDGEASVGTHVDFSHGAATPVGMKATATIGLVEMNGRRLRFRVACRDERDEIGAGFHERVVIDEARFLGRLAEKRAARA